MEDTARPLSSRARVLELHPAVTTCEGNLCSRPGTRWAAPSAWGSSLTGCSHAHVSARWLWLPHAASAEWSGRQLAGVRSLKSAARPLTELNALVTTSAVHCHVLSQQLPLSSAFTVITWALSPARGFDFRFCSALVATCIYQVAVLVSWFPAASWSFLPSLCRVHLALILWIMFGLFTFFLLSSFSKRVNDPRYTV